MARYRSREAETEDVNPRRLRRGAVKRQHLSRWSVGHDELAPGVVGPGHLQPSVIERIIEAGTGSGQVLIVAAADQSFDDGGAYVDADSIVYRHGFALNTVPSDQIVWPIDAVGEIQVEFAWDTYDGGGTIELEVDGEVPEWGLIATGTSGQEGCKRRTVHINEGAVVKVFITQNSGDPQTGTVWLEFAVPDPSLGLEGEDVVVVGQITDSFTVHQGEPIEGRITETGAAIWQGTDDSVWAVELGGASAIADWPEPLQLAIRYVETGFADGTIHVDVDPIGESNNPAYRNGIAFRFVDALNFWVWFNYRSPGGALQYYLRSYVAGVLDYDSGALTTGARDTGAPIPLEVILDGTSIKAYYDGVLRQDIVDTTHQTATKHGLVSLGYGATYFSATPGIET